MNWKARVVRVHRHFPRLPSLDAPHGDAKQAVKPWLSGLERAVKPVTSAPLGLFNMHFPLVFPRKDTTFLGPDLIS